MPKYLPGVISIFLSFSNVHFIRAVISVKFASLRKHCIFKVNYLTSDSQDVYIFFVENNLQHCLYIIKESSYLLIASLVWASLVAQMVKSLPDTKETQFQSLGWEVLWSKDWLPTPVFLPGGLHEQRILSGYSPWGCKEFNTRETNISPGSFSVLESFMMCGISRNNEWASYLFSN